MSTMSLFIVVVISALSFTVSAAYTVSSQLFLQ